MQDHTFGFRTRALHAGSPPDPTTGARAMPIYLSSSFVFDSTEHAAELFALRTYGNIYSRIGNPTVAAFEERMASLEGGLGAVATASGLAAQLMAILCLAEAGDHIVATASLYGGTVTQFTVTLKRMGITCTLVPGDDPQALRAAIRPNTKLVYTETIGNPLGNIADLAALATIAHDAGLPLIVDNTFASPVLCRPIEWGADIVVHSATKFISGHGTVIAGVIVESGKFPWHSGKHPLLSEPSPGYHDMNFAETFAEYAYLMRARTEVLRDVGASLSPMSAWLLLQGLETLPLRMKAHVENARIVANFLRGRDEVAWVRYAELEDSPYHALARTYLPNGAGAVFTFGLRGGREAGRAFIEALELWSHLANVGDAKSLVIHPASTTHQQLTDAELAASGVTPEMVRLSVGLEDPADLLWDLGKRFARGRPGRGCSRCGRVILTTVGARRELLTRSRTVAMVGASANTTRPSYFVFSYLRTRRVFDVSPVNPTIATIDGIRAYPSLAAYAAERGAPDIVDVFRRPAEAPQVARDAIAAGAKAIWFQYGVINEEAIRLADDAGLDVVVDRCIKIESARFDGGLSIGGLNSGLISSKRALPLGRGAA